MSATKFISGVVLLITACLLLSVTRARAETEKGRLVIHVTKFESIEVGDVPDHSVGLEEAKGLVFFENGEVATSSEVVTFEIIKWVSTFQVYDIVTFEDGSTRVIKWQGTHTRPHEGKPDIMKGTYSYVQGTGRFEGIKGSGSWSGKWFESVATGYINFTGTYTLPKK